MRISNWLNDIKHTFLLTLGVYQMWASSTPRRPNLGAEPDPHDMLFFTLISENVPLGTFQTSR